MGESNTQRKVLLALVGLFDNAALLLAAIGLYVVMAYAVATRCREFGIRMAFGAVCQDIIRLVLRGQVGQSGHILVAAISEVQRVTWSWQALVHSVGPRLGI